MSSCQDIGSDMNNLPVISDSAISRLSGTHDGVDVDTLVEAFFSGKSEKTIESYRHDLKTFSEFLGAEDIKEAAKQIFSWSHGEANALALRYRKRLSKERGLKPTTVNRHLASLRSLVAMGQALGIVPWKLSVKNEKTTAYKDISGPDTTGIKLLLMAADFRGDKLARRNRALLMMLYTAGLRRNEAVSLDFPADVSLENRTIKVLGKGKTEQIGLTLPEKTVDAIRKWIEVRGDSPGPLFVNLDPVGKGDGRLSGRSVHRIVKALGQHIGLNDLHPHSLRHSAITNALEKAKGRYDLEECCDFSRHSDVKTMMIYRKRKKNVQGDLSELLAADL
jgi:integrase/recombinase XerC